jgi:hypothetical protein
MLQPATRRATPRRVFVVYDFSIPMVKEFLAAASIRATEQGVILSVPGVDDLPPGAIWNNYVQSELLSADIIVAFVDLPNANVGFEIGYALSLKKPVRLFHLSGDSGKWTRQSALAGITRVNLDISTDTSGNSKSLDQFFTHLSDEAPLDHFTITDSKTASNMVLIGTDDESFLEESRPAFLGDWSVTAGNLSLNHLMTATRGSKSRIYWIICPLTSRNSEMRDGPANAACSVIAGYAFASDCLGLVVTIGGAREVADILTIDIRVNSNWSAIETIQRAAVAILEPVIRARWNSYVSLNWWSEHHDNDESDVGFQVDQNVKLLGERDRKDNWRDLKGETAFTHLQIGSSRAGLTGQAEAILDSGDWKPEDRESLMQRLTGDQSPVITRLVLTADAGVGKSANLAWMYHELNRRKIYAFQFD